MNVIVAADQNWGIGKDNKLLVSIPADMKMFREETSGKVVVMGRKTLESFPNGLPLKNRTNIVITKNKDYDAKGAIVVHSIEEALEEIKKNPKRMLKEVRKQLQNTGIGTKSQQALKLQQEQNKHERKVKSREQKMAEADRMFELKQQKKKEKHKGH